MCDLIYHRNVEASSFLGYYTMPIYKIKITEDMIL
jgi:hypothetical protein